MIQQHIFYYLSSILYPNQLYSYFQIDLDLQVQHSKHLLQNILKIHHPYLLYILAD
nr:MAG TPA_asm: hypothetical protein [Bacteriophage sp.]